MKSLKFSICTYPALLLFCLFFLSHLSSSATVYYVKTSGNDGLVGTSWGNAFKTLQKALSVSGSGDQIWVAAGTYYPDEGAGATNGSTSSSFELFTNVAIYGGFAGNESLLSSRNWSTNTTILSGDLNQNDGSNFSNYSDNAQSVVKTSYSSITSSCILDGFTITGGNGGVGAGINCIGGSNPTIKNCIFTLNKGTQGAAVNSAVSGPDFYDCSFIDNQASASGGSVRIYYGGGTSFERCSFRGNEGYSGGVCIAEQTTAYFTNCEFLGNYSDDDGSAFLVKESLTHVYIYHCSFSGNKSNSSSGGCITSTNSADVSVYNSIIWGNSLSFNTSSQGSISFDHCIVSSTVSGSGNLNTDPLFSSEPDYTLAPQTAGDLSLQSCSPAIDAGSSSNAPSDDIIGNSRPTNTTYDIGAYESQSSVSFPTANCRNRTVTLNASGSVTITAAQIDNGSTDPCGISSLTLDQYTFDCNDKGSNTVILDVSNTFGLGRSCLATVTVVDNQNLVVSCPANITQNIDPGACGAIVSYSVSSTNNCTSTLIRSDATGLESGDLFPVGTSTLKYEIVDGGNSLDSCSFTVTIIDNEAPTISCPSSLVYATINSSCQASVTARATFSDNCEIASVTSSYPNYTNTINFSGSSYPSSWSVSNGFSVGTVTVSFEVSDASGNTASCSVDVTVEDTDDPNIYCPGVITTYAGINDCEADVTYTVGSFDNCGIDTLIQTAGLPSGSTFSVGTTTNSFTVTDVHGNSASCSFDVYVKDLFSPDISCPANTTLDTDSGSCGAVFNFNISATDNCSFTITQLDSTGLNTGDEFPVGTTTLSYLVTDLDSNTDNCSFSIKVEDKEKPVITCPAPIVQSNDSGQCDAIILFSVNATDNCSATISQIDATGLSSGDVFPQGMTTLSYMAEDPSGNLDSCSFSVTIEDTEAPTLNCPADFFVQNDLGKCSANIPYTVNVSDNCRGFTRILDLVSTSGYSNTDTAYFNTFALPLGGSFYAPFGTSTFTFTLIDASNNVNSCSFNIIVEDTIAPSISCPTSIQLPNDAGQCGKNITYFTPTGTDNCGATTLQTNGLGSGAFFPMGTTIETYRVTDLSGNTDSCSFSITITDDEAPQFTILGDNPLYVCEGGSYVEYGATATDNCDASVGQNILIDNSGVNTASEGNYAVTYTVTDANGNSTQISRSVIVLHTPAQLAPQNCGSCSQIRFDFCEGEAPPDLEQLLTTNANFEANSSFLWYADNNNSQGSPISTPVPNMVNNNTNFYWVSQIENDCEGPARRVRVRVRKTSTVVMDLPAIGCGSTAINLASWVSDSRGIATGFTFYDGDPALGSSALGSVTATKGNVDNGQNMIVSLPASPITYYAMANNNTGCQVTGSDEVISASGASLDSIPNFTVNAGDLVQVSFTSPYATHILWSNHSSFNNPYIGLFGNLGLGDLVFTAQNITTTSQTAMIRAIAYNGNCAGQVRDFNITVLPGTNNRQAGNHLQLTASKVNAHDVELNWQIDYEFALTHLEIEKQMNGGDWVTIDSQDVDQHGVGSHYNVTLQDGSYLDRSGMGNLTKYRLKLVHPDGRAIWSQEVEVNFDYFDNKRFTLYPNPSNGRFNLRAAGPLEGEWRYKLSDQLGRTILIGKLQGSETAFDISHLPTAHYFLLLTSPEGKLYLKKIAKQ